MIKAMDRVDRPSRLLVAIVGMSLGFLDVGCAGMSGLRSVGTERSSFLGFRNSSQAPSPTPSKDLYAQNMHAGDTKPDSKAKPAELAAGRREDGTESTRPTAELTTVTNLDESLPESAPTTKPVGDKTTRVTLGRPEPLPSPAQPATATGELASKPSSSRWNTAGTKRNGKTESVPPPLEVAGEATRKTATAPLANNLPRKAEVLDPKAILAQAEARLNGMNTYQVKISRIERVGGQLQPEEDILLSIQRDPKAVRLEWADAPNKGREVIYSSTLDPQMIFVHMPSSPIPIPTMKFAVDSPMVMKNSRHAITEAGFDTIIDNLRKSRGPGTKEHPAPDQLDYRGIETPPGLDAPSHHFVRKTPSGETWNVYLDSRTMLPRLVSAEDSRGELVERYIYREVRENPADLKTASAFVPDQRWGEPNGLFSRLARAAAGPSQPTVSQSTTR
jgi:Protein of unknown function (DUF1571)